MKKKFSPLLLFFAVLLFFSACIKDTDFNQTDAIEITPALELDFIFFTLDEEQFLDINTGDYQLTVADTTDFTFLDDEFTVDNLQRAEFFFKVTNSLPVNFESKIQFLNNSNELFFEINIPVTSGTVANSVITEFIQNIEGDQILQLTNADKVVISNTASSSIANLEGTYNFQSKTAYYLKIGL